MNVDFTKVEKLLKKHKKNAAFGSLVKTVRAGRTVSQTDLLGIDELTDDDITLILELAYIYKHGLLESGIEKKLDVLRGKSIINFFCEESTRTRSSFELAGKHLGADTINVSGKSSSMKKKGETLNDTARILNKLNADGIVIRDAHSQAPAMIAKEIDAPVINAGDGWHQHPTQGLLDVFTMLEHFGTIEGKTIAIVGDVVHSRVAGSLIRIAKRFGMAVRLVAPPTFIPAEVEKVFGVKVFHAMEKGIQGADVAYILRIQTERAATSYIPTIRDYSKLYCMNKGRLPLLADNAIVMHAGPINREVDISTEVMESDHSKVETQVENGLPIRMAILTLLIQ